MVELSLGVRQLANVSMPADSPEASGLGPELDAKGNPKASRAELPRSPIQIPHVSLSVFSRSNPSADFRLKKKSRGLFPQMTLLMVHESWLSKAVAMQKRKLSVFLLDFCEFIIAGPSGHSSPQHFCIPDESFGKRN